MHNRRRKILTHLSITQKKNNFVRHLHLYYPSGASARIRKQEAIAFLSSPQFFFLLKNLLASSQSTKYIAIMKNSLQLCWMKHISLFSNFRKLYFMAIKTAMRKQSCKEKLSEKHAELYLDKKAKWCQNKVLIKSSKKRKKVVIKRMMHWGSTQIILLGMFEKVSWQVEKET